MSTETKQNLRSFALTDKAVAEAGFAKGARVLDIGCGTGEATEYLAGKGLRMTGVDSDKYKILEAQLRYPGLKLREANGCVMPFEGKTFDGAIMENALHEMYNVAEALHEAYCVLKNGGRLAVHSPYWRTLTDEAKQRIAEKRSLPAPGEGDGPDGCLSEEQLAARDECVLDGALVMDKVQEEMLEIGYFNIKIQDVSDAAGFVGENPNIGYMLLTAQKE